MLITQNCKSIVVFDIFFFKIVSKWQNGSLVQKYKNLIQIIYSASCHTIKYSDLSFPFLLLAASSATNCLFIARRTVISWRLVSARGVEVDLVPD